MPRNFSREASKPNPILAPFRKVIGTWSTVGTHPMVPNTVFHGHSSFEWLEGGAFMLMRQEIDEPGIPTGIAIIGGDDTTGELSMLYFDERSVSRIYQIEVRDDGWTWRRDAPGLSQRFVFTVADDGRSMVGKGRLSKDGKNWEGDLELTYTRAE